MHQDAAPPSMREAFDKQIGWCREASPFTAAVLTILRDDLVARGEASASLIDWPGDPTRDAVPLRLAGALHFLALRGTEPGLARCYPPLGAASDSLRTEVLEVAVRRRDIINRFLESPPQTNEVGRSGILLGGFLVVAKRTGLPLRLLEIGASAGLNLHWDRYAYNLDGHAWGDPLSPVRIAPHWSGPLPPLDVTPSVVSRAACDRAPVDLLNDDERLRLISYIWPDQTTRLERTRAAIDLCATIGPAVECAEAAPWLGTKLGEHVRGAATVVFNSIMWQYMSGAEQAEVRDTIHRAGATADQEAPLAWLRFEPAQEAQLLELRLSLWPDRLDLRLATAQAHGADVTWLGTRVP